MHFGDKEAYAGGREVKVSVTNLTKCYDDLLVLDDINFDIYKGEMLCIVGPTGCGKTNFPELPFPLHPHHQRLHHGGRQAGGPENTTISPLYFRKFRPFPGSLWRITSASACASNGCPKWKLKNVWSGMLDIVGLARYRTYYPQQLSASMEQRVVIARNFAINPDLLLMDEPYGHWM